MENKRTLELKRMVVEITRYKKRYSCGTTEAYKLILKDNNNILPFGDVIPGNAPTELNYAAISMGSIENEILTEKDREQWRMFAEHNLPKYCSAEATSKALPKRVQSWMTENIH